MIARAVACLILASLLTCVRAEEAPARLPDKVDLAEILRLVSSRNPRLAAERIAVDASRAERVAATAYPDPTIALGRYKPAGGARTVVDAASQSQATLDLPVLLGGQRKARIEAADRALDAVRAHVGAVDHETAGKTAEGFVALLAAQERVSALEAAVADVQRLAYVVAERMANGMASRYESTRAEIELATLRARLTDARMERAARGAELAAMAAAPGWKPFAVGKLGSNGMPLDFTVLANSIQAGSAQLLAARHDESAAQAALKRVQRERVPVPVLTVGRIWTGDPFGGANYFGVSTEIPVLDRRLGPIAKAEAELRAARQRREAVEIDAELLRLIDVVSARRSALAQFDRNIGTRLDALRQMAEDYYQLGRGSILERIDASRSRLEAGLGGLEARAQLMQEEVRLLTLIGKLPD